MSTIVSSFVKDRVSAAQIATLNVTDCTPKAFACFNGLTMGAFATFNISSITDSAVGTWTPLFTALMAGYHAPSGAGHNAGVSWAYISILPSNQLGIQMTAYGIAAPNVPMDTNQVGVHTVGRLA